jgi:hypothetical protein
VIEKDKEYQKRMNLEVPPRHKGNSFAALDNYILGDISSCFGIEIEDDELEKNEIIIHEIHKLSGK